MIEFDVKRFEPRGFVDKVTCAETRRLLELPTTITLLYSCLQLNNRLLGRLCRFRVISFNSAERLPQPLKKPRQIMDAAPPIPRSPSDLIRLDPSGTFVTDADEEVRRHPTELASCY